MSNNRNNNWEIDDEDEDDFEAQYRPSREEEDSPLVRSLRKQLRNEQKRLKEYDSKLQEFEKTQKERIIKDVLTARGVNPEIAEFIPADIEASQDAVSAWLDKKGTLFGIQKPVEPAVNPNDIAAMQKMNSVLDGAETPTSANTLEGRIASANSEEELLSILRGE